MFNPFRVKNNGYERVNEGEHPNDDQVLNAWDSIKTIITTHEWISGLQGERGR